MELTYWPSFCLNTALASRGNHLIFAAQLPTNTSFPFLSLLFSLVLFLLAPIFFPFFPLLGLDDGAGCVAGVGQPADSTKKPRRLLVSSSAARGIAPPLACPLFAFRSSNVSSSGLFPPFLFSFVGRSLAALGQRFMNETTKHFLFLSLLSGRATSTSRRKFSLLRSLRPNPFYSNPSIPFTYWPLGVPPKEAIVFIVGFSLFLLFETHI